MCSVGAELGVCRLRIISGLRSVRTIRTVTQGVVEVITRPRDCAPPRWDVVADAIVTDTRHPRLPDRDGVYRVRAARSAGSRALRRDHGPPSDPASTQTRCGAAWWRSELP